MSDLIAKPIIDNKFWIVEESGSKIATIQAVENGGFTYVNNLERKHFSSISGISAEFGVRFELVSDCNKVALDLKFPSCCIPHNSMIDYQSKLPIYTKEKRSSSFYCAGYYVITIKNLAAVQFCPRLVTVARNKYLGPFMTEQEAIGHL